MSYTREDIEKAVQEGKKRKGTQRRWHFLTDKIRTGGFSYGLEIGVKSGRNLKELLIRCPNLRMVGIDPWAGLPDNSGRRLSWTGWDHDRHYHKALAVQKEFPDRVRLVKGCSFNVVHLFEDGIFDFAFLDGDHGEEETLRDIKDWWPKVKNGGMFSGHDWHFPSVRAAVLKAFPEEIVTVWPSDHVWSLTVEHPCPYFNR